MDLVPQMPAILFATALCIRVRPTARSLEETERGLYSAARRCVREARWRSTDRERLRNSAAVILVCRRLVLSFLDHARGAP